jgi:hypothetical protein
LYALGLLTSSDRGPRRREIDRAREDTSATETYPRKSESLSICLFPYILPSKISVIIEVLGVQMEGND